MKIGVAEFYIRYVVNLEDNLMVEQAKTMIADELYSIVKDNNVEEYIDVYPTTEFSDADIWEEIKRDE